MSTSNSTHSTFGGGHYYIQIAWVATPNAAANTSSLTVSAIIGSYGSGYDISSSMAKTGSISVNGSVIGNISTNPTIGSGESKTIGSFTTTVAHDTNGNCTFSASVSYNINVTLSGSYVGNISTGGTWSLPQIITTPGAPPWATLSANGSTAKYRYGESFVVNYGVASGTVTGYETLMRCNPQGAGWQAWTTTLTWPQEFRAGTQYQAAVRAMNGSYASGWTYSNVLTKSGHVYVRAGGGEQPGTVFVRAGGTMHLAKRVYVRVNGAMVETY